jgi:hypothetical protein
VRVLALLLHSAHLLPAAAAATTASLSRCSRLSSERPTDGQTGLLLLLRACAALPDAAAGMLTLVANAVATRPRKASSVQPVRKPRTLSFTPSRCLSMYSVVMHAGKGVPLAVPQTGATIPSRLCAITRSLASGSSAPSLYRSTGLAQLDPLASSCSPS